MIAGMSAVKGRMGIVGASGFIGGELADQAARLGWRVVGFSRSEQLPDEVVTEWRRWSDTPDLGGLRVVVNLAGESIARRWTKSRRERLDESRVGVTRSLVAAAGELETPPEVLVNGSAVGIYGDGGNRRLTEFSPPGNGFLADLCERWEAAALPLAEAGTRVVRLRTGIVLGHDGEAWERLRRVFRLGLGGNLGHGRQWMPWIHVEDLVAAILHAIDADVGGPVNGVSPEPERNRNFTRKLAAAVRRPAFFHAPEWALKLAFGGFGESLLASQRAIPAALLASGYRFRFPTLEAALEDLL
jgi:uncharacterized protein (TIGR01777 family)